MTIKIKSKNKDMKALEKAAKKAGVINFEISTLLDELEITMPDDFSDKLKLIENESTKMA